MYFQKAKTLYQYRELISNFVLRDIKAKYKDSIFGYLWTLLDPLLLMLIYVLIFSVIVRIKVENYPIFILTGILPWLFFASSISRAMDSIRGNSTLMMKVYFPREIFPVSHVITGIIEFCFSLIVLIPFLLIYQVAFSWKLFFIPAILLAQILFILGISLILSIMVAYFKDVGNFVTAALRIWFYLTPILYPITLVPPKYKFYFYLNPMTIIIYLYRWAILGTEPPDFGMTTMSILLIILIFMFGVQFFSTNEADVIKRL